MQTYSWGFFAHPLYNLLKKGKSWEWTEQHTNALELLIKELRLFQQLGPVYLTDPIHVECEFREHGSHCNLWQKGPEGPERPLEFSSHSFQRYLNEILRFTVPSESGATGRTNEERIECDHSGTQPSPSLLLCSLGHTTQPFLPAPSTLVPVLVLLSQRRHEALEEEDTCPAGGKVPLHGGGHPANAFVGWNRHCRDGVGSSGELRLPGAWLALSTHPCKAKVWEKPFWAAHSLLKLGILAWGDMALCEPKEPQAHAGGMLAGSSWVLPRA